MKLNTKFKLGMMTLLSATMLMACSDDSDKPSGTTAASEENPVVAYSQIPQCDAYLNAMQACANSVKSSEDQEKLAQALAELGSKMAQMSDEDELKQHCQTALDHIAEHKKVLGCTA